MADQVPLDPACPPTDEEQRMVAEAQAAADETCCFFHVHERADRFVQDPTRGWRAE